MCGRFSELLEEFRLRELILEAKKLSPEEVPAISIRAGIHNEDGSLTEMYREPPFEATCPNGPATASIPFTSIHSTGLSGIYHSNDNVELVQDVYGKWMPKRPGYATLDGLPIDEWVNKQEVAHEPTSDTTVRGSFRVMFYCWMCRSELKQSVCNCGNADLAPILVPK